MWDERRIETLWRKAGNKRKGGKESRRKGIAEKGKGRKDEESGEKPTEKNTCRGSNHCPAIVRQGRYRMYGSMGEDK